MIRRNPGILYRFDETMTHGEELLFYMSLASQGRYTFTKKVILHCRRSPDSAMSNLINLAKGYSLLRNKISRLAVSPTWVDKLIYTYKTRKIMFLSFVNSGQITLAFRYLLYGAL
jgi:hypothetical protein